MRTVTLELESISPYSQSRRHEAPKLAKESADEYERRTWREKMTLDDAGNIAIPAMSVKMALDSAAKRLSEQIAGRGKKTWTNAFVSGVIPADQCYSLGIPKGKVDYIDLWCDAQGIRGGNKRVARRFPIVPKWRAPIVLDVIDDTIPEDLLERYMAEAGKFVGIGRFRPERGGFNGRFEVGKVTWTE
jgi:hypothetical protein